MALSLSLLLFLLVPVVTFGCSGGLEPASFVFFLLFLLFPVLSLAPSRVFPLFLTFYHFCSLDAAGEATFAVFYLLFLLFPLRRRRRPPGRLNSPLSAGASRRFSLFSLFLHFSHFFVLFRSFLTFPPAALKPLLFTGSFCRLSPPFSHFSRFLLLFLPLSRTFKPFSAELQCSVRSRFETWNNLVFRGPGEAKTASKSGPS